MLRTATRSSVFLALVLLCATPAPAAPAAGRHYAIATASRQASEAGLELLRAGGNAVDAAVGAAFALAVAEPYSSGLGGGGFALSRVGTELSFLDFREVAPKAASRDMFLRKGVADPALSRDGALAAGVPGAVAGYLALHARWGKLPRARVLAPAIALAEKGVPVDQRYREEARARLELLRSDPEMSAIFLVRPKGGGEPEVPALGALLVQKDLARTLRAIAARGPEEVYRGETARRLAADMQRRGGIVTLADLAAYAPRERKPVVGTFRGLAVASSPPPSAGGDVVLTLLGGLEGLAPSTPWHDVAALHLYIEISKRAFADRYLLGDPAFVADPTPALLERKRLELLPRLVGPKAEPATSIPAGQGSAVEKLLLPSPRRGGDDTTHISVIDADGNAVAMTTTINYTFGAGIVARGTGIIWNDEMDDFAIAPGVPNVYGIVGSEANSIAPGKVPLSSMAPTLVFDGPTPRAPVRMAVGAAGGPRIPTTVAQIILDHLVFGADIEQAVAMGRVHHQHLPDVVSVEPFTLDAATVAALEQRGQHVQIDPPASNANAVAVVGADHVRTASADPRGEGAALAE